MVYVCPGPCPYYSSDFCSPPTPGGNICSDQTVAQLLYCAVLAVRVFFFFSKPLLLKTACCAVVRVNQHCKFLLTENQNNEPKKCQKAQQK